MSPLSAKAEVERSEALVRGNLRLVTLIGRQFSNRGVDTPDLIQEGNIGLIKASRRFDESRGVRFTTYASWWIRQGMGRALAEQGRTIRLPNHIGGALREIARTAHDLVGRLGRAPATTEIAERLASTSQRVEALLDLRAYQVSLDAPMAGQREQQVPLIDLLSLSFSRANEAATRSPEGALEERALTHEVRKAVSRLRAHERDVLSLRFGLEDGEPRNLQEIAHRLCLPIHQVRQLEQRAMKKLRHDPALKSLRPGG